MTDRDRRGRFIPFSAVVCGLLLAVAMLAVASCAPAVEGRPATAAGAGQFIEEAEERLLEHWIRAEQAAWVKSNFITEDTEAIAAAALEELIATTAEIAAESTRFDGLELDAEIQRKMRLIKTSLPLVAPRDAAKQEELSQITTRMEGLYGKGTFCSEARGGDCLDLTAMTPILAESRDAEELLDLWVGWRTVSPPMRKDYRRFVELANQGASDLGFSDLGELWRSAYDMTPDEFAVEVDRLWEQVRPLYEALHCHVRASLAEQYGTDVVPLDQPIPAHLLGNMWSQSWGNIYDLAGPGKSDPGYDLTDLLRARGVDAMEMVRFGERFFTSLGFEPLPQTFWERSLFTKPQDRDVVCHASAWDLDYVDDLRIKMCIDTTGEDFVTVHHELGHNFYQRAYNEQPPLFRNSANDGFHEGIGDTVALSITPEYLVQVGLLDRLPPAGGDLGLLMKMALDKVAFLPFGLLVDQYRWKIFSGEIPTDGYNAGWWELREKYQGVRAPVARTESDFDAGAKYHVPSNVPYTRYFLAHILQFQFHRALCDIAGFEGPLHRCSIYGNKEAGSRLIRMLEMGMSRPWPDALEAMTGQREMDATAILDYFAPLKQWLDEQNRGANLRLVERLRLFRRRSRPWLVHDLAYRLAVTGVPVDPLRSARILAWLLDCGLARQRDVSRPLPASLGNIGRVHSEAYLESIERPETLEAVFGFVPPDDLRQRVIDQQRLVCGGTIQATRLALRTGRPAINLGGGFHHAAPDRGMALCLFNDIAVAIARLRAKGFEDDIVVVDLDLHDGNGTRVAFAEDPSVFTFSIHNQTWDSRDAIANRSIELGPDVEDRLYLDTLAAELPSVIESQRPGLVIYVAGTDPSADDRIGNWRISDAGMLARDRFVLDLVEGARPTPRLVSVLGGGYGENAWRHTARGVAWQISRQEYRPSRGMEPVVKLFRLLQAEREPEPSSDGDAGWTLTEEDLGAVSPGSLPGGLILDALTPHAVELSLERFGFFEQIRALGFGGLVLQIEATPPLGHTLRLVSEEPGPTADILMEQRISRNRSSFPGMELLYAEWLLLQNPRAEFTLERPPLPGQDRPGLGLLREAVAWWIVLCEELRLDGILFVPAHYYMAALGRRHLSFRTPEDAAVFEALRRAVADLDLSAASRAIDTGRVVDERSGAPVRWPTPQMVLAVSERLRRQQGSPGYDDEVRSRLESMRFRLIEPGVSAGGDHELS